MIEHEAAAELQHRILSLFDDDLGARTLVEGIMDGMEGKELQELLGMDEKEFATKRRLVRRRIDKAFPNGWVP
jgi:RNA polymerase sigma-70 factor (ECF subfamily)